MANPHLFRTTFNPDRTSVTVMGMDPEAFTSTDTISLETILRQHPTLPEGLRVLFSPNEDHLNRFVLTNARDADIPEEGDPQHKYWFVLNEDDETAWSFDNTVFPGAFISELTHFLATIAARNGVMSGTIEYLYAASRAGYIVAQDTNPDWAAYDALFAL